MIENINFEDAFFRVQDTKVLASPFNDPKEKDLHKAQQRLEIDAAFDDQPDTKDNDDDDKARDEYVRLQVKMKVIYQGVPSHFGMSAKFFQTLVSTIDTNSTSDSVELKVNTMGHPKRLTLTKRDRVLAQVDGYLKGQVDIKVAGAENQAFKCTMVCVMTMQVHDKDIVKVLQAFRTRGAKLDIYEIQESLPLGEAA